MPPKSPQYPRGGGTGTTPRPKLWIPRRIQHPILPYSASNIRSSRIFSLAGLSTPSAPAPAAEQGTSDAAWQEAVAMAQERAKG